MLSFYLVIRHAYV